MQFLASVRRLWRHAAFRRLLLVRILTQGADGIVQVGFASYVLFSPYQQPDGWSIAAVLAITLLPFSVIGPFVSIVLDRWSRRQIMVITDYTRVFVALALGALVFFGAGGNAVKPGIMAVALVAMSLNRFLLATLSAAMPHTIEPDEYLAANTVMPVIGPAGVILGGAVALGTRRVLGTIWPTYGADAVVFVLAAVGFCCSATLALGFGRRALGPDHEHHHSAREVLVGLRAAFGHLRHRRPAALALATIGVQRVIFGVAMVGTILMYRNYFHTLDQIDPAMADLGLWAGATGVGFVCASAVTPPLAARFGMRTWMVTLLVLAGVFQIVPGSVFQKPTLLVASFLLGLVAQSFKICTDTLVQAHIEDTYKGRVFVVYDMIFNAALVTAAVIAASILPPNGRSMVMFVGLGVAYLVVAVGFFVLSGRIGAAEFSKGTESTRTGVSGVGA